MCGIFGITKATKFNQSNVSGATLLCHRGPDNVALNLLWH
jgi:glutamine phosphoribosylpyrophosphate amidotransferase